MTPLPTVRRTPSRGIPALIVGRGAGWAVAQRWTRVRLLGAGLLFTCMFGLLARRAWQLQVREAEQLRQLAEEQYVHEIELPSRRGRILDRNGAELAASVEVDSIYANPRQIDAAGTADEIARALAKPLGMDRHEIARRLRSHHYFAWLKRHVLPDEARAVRALNLTGVYLTKEPQRYYPNRTLAGSLLGWAGVDGRGLEGLELFYDRELRGKKAEVQGLRDARGVELLPSGLGDAEAKAGHDVVTTIDKFIQYRLEHALADGVAKSRAKGGVAVALDPKNGEILAMTAVPFLNPNDPSSVKGARNKAVTDPFEPGSTMKTFSISAAIEAGLVKPDDRWFCENGRMQVGPAVIHDAEPIGAVSTTEVLAKSSNICTAKIARRSGRERVESMLRRFHFGAPTGVDLPGERAGLLRPAKRWGEVELATISFGQGVTATPVQIASGYAAIANGGTWWRPHFLRRVVDEHDKVLGELQPEGQKIISPELAATMRKMLHAVTLKGGTAEKLAIPGYPAAGKTGTAQKVDPVTRRYSAEKWASSFVGFAPLDDPRLLIFVMVDEPQGTHYGGSVAGPIWREVMVDALRYLNVPPDPNDMALAQAAAAKPGAATQQAAVQQNAATQKSDVAAQQAPGGLSDAEFANAFAGVEPAVEGFAGGEEGADPAAAATAGDGVPREGRRGPTDAQPATVREVPDFTGMSMGEALEAARRADVALEIKGSGRAVAQDPHAGPVRLERPERAERPLRCRVLFAPPQ